MHLGEGVSSRFQFYEVVVVADSGHNEMRSLIGEEGTVLGMAQDDESKCWSYAVSMASTGKVCSFEEWQLGRTGKHQDRLNLYSGEAVKVQVDPKTGKGSIK